MNESVKSLIENHPFFHGMKREYVGAIAQCASEVSFGPGEVLFREGEPANRFYLIGSGKVALQAHQPADGTALIQDLGPGDVLGWSWLFPPFEWHFQATTTEPTKAIVLNGAHLLIAAERNPAFGFELMKRVTQLVIQRLQATRRQLLALQFEAAMDG